MNVANLFRAFAGLLAMLLSPAAPSGAQAPSADMLVMELGSWRFSLPRDWALDKKHAPGVPYFESADGSKGCYVKEIGGHRDSGSAAKLAADVQRIQRKSLEAVAGHKWRIMADESSSTADGTLAVLDLFDSEHSYRVLSKVIAGKDGAVQLTLHDYDCKDYAASVKFFAPIAASLGARSQ
jgi:hypothetical protein